MRITPRPFISKVSLWSSLILLSTLPIRAAEIHQTDNPAEIITAAKAIMAADRACALITIDASGIPRARTVNASPPEADMTVWIATKPNTRKVEQIRNNPNVTLYFNDDEAASYVSIMGRASLHDDATTIAAKNFYPEEELLQFWPAFPEDFLLIEVSPTWIEVEGHGISADPATWQPQGVEP